jgi:hypothetical protein
MRMPPLIPVAVRKIKLSSNPDPRILLTLVELMQTNLVSYKQIRIGLQEVRHCLTSSCFVVLLSP